MAGELEQVVWLVQVAKADIDESGEQGLTPVTPARGRWDFAPAHPPPLRHPAWALRLLTARRNMRLHLPRRN